MSEMHEIGGLNRRDFLALTLGSGLAGLGRAAASGERLRVSVIGSTGRGDYGHGLDVIWRTLPEVQIVGVADADPVGLAAAKRRLDCAAGFAEYRALLEVTRPDVVAVCPRHVDQHLDMILAAIESGARAVYVEKPFCRTPAESDRIVSACAKRDVKLAVAHRNRYHPALPAVQKAVKDGAIGRLLEIRSRGKEDRRGGVQDLWVLGSHVLNLIQYFGGDPLACSAQLYQAGRVATPADVAEGEEGIGPIAGDELHARFELASGVPAFFDSIRDAEKASENYGLTLVGSRGFIHLRIDRDPVAHLIEGPPGQPPANPRAWIPITCAGVGLPESVASVGPDVSSHRLAALDLLASVRENRSPLCSAENGRTTVEMICAVLASHRRAGARMTWPLADRGNPLYLEAVGHGT